MVGGQNFGKNWKGGHLKNVVGGHQSGRWVIESGRGGVKIWENGRGRSK